MQEMHLSFKLPPKPEEEPFLPDKKEESDKVSTAFFETALSVFISVILGLIWWGLREFCSSVLSFESCTGFGLSKVYEDWKNDDTIDQMPDHNKKNSQFQILGHQRNLLDLTIRHLKRINYCCLSDVRRTVMPVPAPHEAGSGFNSQWKNLSESYRRLIYVDALAKTHPRRRAHRFRFPLSQLAALKTN